MGAMFSEFSRGYYVGRLYLAPNESEHAVMQRELHERINEQLYSDDEELRRLDAPLVMKLRNRHFAVHGADDVPDGTLEVPERLLDDAGVRNPPALRELLLAKPDRAAQLLELSSGIDGEVGI